MRLGALRTAGVEPVVIPERVDMSEPVGRDRRLPVVARLEAEPHGGGEGLRDRGGRRAPSSANARRASAMSRALHTFAIIPPGSRIGKTADVKAGRARPDRPVGRSPIRVVRPDRVDIRAV